MPHWLTHGLLSPLFALAFIPFFMWFDRDVGDGSEGGLSRAKAMDVAVIGGGLLGFLVFGLYFALLGVMWSAWRSMGFNAGALAPTTPKAALWCLLRYALLLPISLLALCRGDPWWHLGVPLAIAIALDLAMRADFGHAAMKAEAAGLAMKGDTEAVIERCSGAFFGCALVAYALFPWDLLAVVTAP